METQKMTPPSPVQKAPVFVITTDGGFKDGTHRQYSGMKSPFIVIKTTASG
jgi:hypothetical protein